MSEWKVWEGSTEQFDEINKSFSEHGVLFRLDTGKDIEPYYSFTKRIFTHYLICNPHPLADMICQQARTGQPVWWKYKTRTEVYQCAGNPDWDDVNCEYSFTEFKEEV